MQKAAFRKPLIHLKKAPHHRITLTYTPSSSKIVLLKIISMYKIETVDFGIKITFKGFLYEDEMVKWSEELNLILDALPDHFSILVDMRDLKTLVPESKLVLEEAQRSYRDRLIRSATIVSREFTSMQVKKIGNRSGVNESKIFINSSKDFHWEQTALNWILNGERIAS